MPSPAGGRKFYRRKGGAYRKKGHGYKKVGYGKGTHSKRSTKSDRSRRAKKNPKMRQRYPQHYD
ncbi:MAG: hypothetical protein PHG80_11950 [Methanoregulaceae archaeon]|nr:hypothetical protein [Methanoregulaceae archaeon]